MSYRETPAPAPLRDLAECVWVREGAGHARILPDGCMDLVQVNGAMMIAGPDTSATLSDQRTPIATGIRFRPGALPRLLGIPASELHDQRVALESVRPEAAGGSLTSVAARLMRRDTTRETTPWSTAQLRHITMRFATGATVQSVADEIGCSPRNLQRHSAAVYGYGPATLRRVLRFRQAVHLLQAGRSVADTAYTVGYADQAHLSRQVLALAGVTAGQLASGANRSTEVPSGSTTVA
ncbi:helix-turn-helix domain-containing protein [Mycolicibacterium gilvum]|uniref:helix-turn-helix domain-containing protein n=1 Tax=Mycolicibacterium gilvum TaxID=1804 RepID=UPI00404624DA